MVPVTPTAAAAAGNTYYSINKFKVQLKLTVSSFLHSYVKGSNSIKGKNLQSDIPELSLRDIHTPYIKEAVV